MPIRHLLTCEGENIGSIPHSEYPRPQLRRKEWLCLNGEWEFEVCGEFRLPERFSRKIMVPFCPESLLSGINECFEEERVFCYRTKFVIPDSFSGKRILLHFGAVDQICTV